MPHAPTAERYAFLRRWTEQHGAQFDRELDLTKLAVSEVDASGEELDFIAGVWRDQTGRASFTARPDHAEPALSAAAHSADSAKVGDAPNPAHGSGASPVDPETGEVFEADVPFEEDEAGTELVLADSELVSLFGRGGPETALRHLESYADAFKSFVKQHELTLEMEDGADYVLAAGWEAGGQLTGVFTEIEATRQIEGGWWARAYAHRPSTGERWSSREAVCLRTESGKRYKPETDLLGMAQTRAARNALRASISVIVTAAGFDAAPLEERAHSPRQRAMLFAVLAQLEKLQPRGRDGWKDWVTNATLTRYGKRISGLNRAQMGQVIDGMEKLRESLAAGEPAATDEPIEPTAEELAEAERIEF